MTEHKTATRWARRSCGTGIAALAVTVAALAISAAWAAPARAGRTVAWGSWEQEALMFDPFTLTTTPARDRLALIGPVARPAGSPTVGVPGPLGQVRTGLPRMGPILPPGARLLVDEPAPSPVLPPAVPAPADDPPAAPEAAPVVGPPVVVPAAAPVYVPERKPLRSPFRPPLI